MCVQNVLTRYEHLSNLSASWCNRETFGIHHTALFRHKNNCIDQLFAEVREQKRAGLLKDVDELKAEIQRVRDTFPTNPNVNVQLIARERDVIDLEAKLTGAYLKEQENPANTDALVSKVAHTLMSSGHFTDMESATHWLQAFEADVGEVATIG